MINFDEEIDRVGTNSSKHDTIQELYGISPRDGLAMWTADMDFRSPECVIESLKKQIDHGIFGYFGDYSKYYEALIEWYLKRHNWKIEPRWVSVTHGLVAAIGIIIRAFSNPGDGVIIFSPVYHSFQKIIKANNRNLIESPLLKNSGQYKMNLRDLEKKLSGKEKILLFCSPHNPGGKTWSKKELIKLAYFCKSNNLLLVSDEIHNDLIYPGEKHLTYPVAAPEILDRLILLVSSSKTFNLAGGLMGNVIIQNPQLRKAFNKAHAATGTTPNRFGMQIAESAYRGGETWLDELMVYLNKNRKLFDDAINKIPGVNSMRLAATYLAWVDFSGTGMNEQEIIHRVHKKAQIAANIGSSFGNGGQTFLRFNFACPTKTVFEAIQRLEYAFGDLQ